ncbi:MAG: hypothetical protein ACRDL0_01230 [Thermoleophilaceae bacterium]
MLGPRKTVEDALASTEESGEPGADDDHVGVAYGRLRHRPDATSLW